MSDSVRLYDAVYLLIVAQLPNLNRFNQITLAEMVTGILRSRNVRFREIGQKINYEGKLESIIDRFRRFVRNENISVEANFLPFLEIILGSLEDDEITLIMDSTKAGGKCICLMLSVYYKGRALPLCWTVFKGRKGHSSAKLQLELLKYIAPLLPKGAQIT